MPRSCRSPNLEGTGAAAVAARRRWFGRLPATAAMASGALVLASGIVLASATGLGSSPVANSQTSDGSPWPTGSG